MALQRMQLREISDKDVLKAMESVPRHEFVPPEYVDQAYADHPLPIGYGQTISFGVGAVQSGGSPRRAARVPPPSWHSLHQKYIPLKSLKSWQNQRNVGWSG